MDSAVREISSSAPAQALVEPKASPPNAIATPAITCRRVGPLASASRVVLSLIIVIVIVLHHYHCPPEFLRSTVPRITAPRENMFKIIFPWAGERPSRHT